jgi:hypothetical protein
LKQNITCSKHAADVSVPLVEALLDDGTDEGGAVEQHPFIALKVKRITLFSPVAWGQCYKTFSVRDLRIFVLS